MNGNINANQIDDYEMEPNPNPRGETLSAYEIIEEKMLNVQKLTLVGIVLFLVIGIMCGSSSDSAGFFIILWIICTILNIIVDSKISKKFAAIEYKNPCICSEKRFYMEAAKAVQDAGFETEKGLFDSLVNGKGFIVIKPGLFDYSMVVTFNSQTNTFSVANKKKFGKADLDDLAMVFGNFHYAKTCSRVVNAIQKRLEHCANSIDRTKEENLNSDTDTRIKTLAGDFFKGWIKNILQYAVVVGVILAIMGIAFFGFYQNSPVNSIKESYLSAFSESVTIGDAFDEFFSHPKWESGVDENGRKIVNFYGGCLYYDDEIDVTVQFLFSSDESQFEVYAVEFNDIPQNIFVINGLLETVYEDYAS